MDPIFEKPGWLESIIHGAVKNAIAAHGPITSGLATSAAKRIAGGIRAGLKKQLPAENGHSACQLRVSELEGRIVALTASFDQQIDYWRNKATARPIEGDRSNQTIDLPVPSQPSEERCGTVATAGPKNNRNHAATRS